MPMTLGEFMRSRAGRMVAGRICSQQNHRGKWMNSFYYVETALDAPVPAAVLIDNWAEANRYRGRGKGFEWSEKFFVNDIGSFGWLNTYSTRFVELPTHYAESSWYVDAIPVKHTALHESFTLEQLGAAPDLASIYADKVAPDKDKSVHRALRYYMLTAYCLLGKTGEFTHRGIEASNLVGALLVDEHGKVLSWGVNTGAYRHAEVNTLLNYFHRTGATRLPAKSVMFSTLKPCKMCSTYIQNARSSVNPTLVWFGQMDPGPAGSALGHVSKPFASLGASKDVKVGHGGGKVGISPQLETDFEAEKDLYRLSAAQWTAASDAANTLFAEAFTTMSGKLDKTRVAVESEQAVREVKVRVLTHLRPWVQSHFK